MRQDKELMLLHLRSATSSRRNRCASLRLRCEMPTITTVTPALWLARFAHLKRCVGEGYCMPSCENEWPQHRNLLPLADRVGGDEGSGSSVLRAVVGCLHEPASNIVERSSSLRTSVEKIASSLPSVRLSATCSRDTADFRRYTSPRLHSRNRSPPDPAASRTNHRRGSSRLLPVGGQMLSQSSRRALPQVIQLAASSGRNSASASFWPR